MKALTKTLILLASFFFSFSSVIAQDCKDIAELNFSNPHHVSPNTYRFPSVLQGVDAIVSVVGSHNAGLYDIDLTNTGDELAFQPQVEIFNQSYHGTEGYVDFQIDFVYANSNAPFVVDKWTVTAVDIDGDSHRLRESVGFSNFNMYTLESNTLLNLSDASTTNMTVFEAYSVANLPGITTDNSQHMVYMQYGGVSSFNIRTRIVDNGGSGFSSASARMFSFSFDPCIINDFVVPNTLPVEFSYFQVDLENSGARLNWETTFEINNDRFEIEKSVDGVLFSKIATIQGQGNSQVASQYTFFDAQPAEGKNYYRLKQIDIDGQFTYSELKEINFNYDQAGFFYTVYPNPATELVTIASPSVTDQTIATLIDKSGKEIMRGTANGQQIQLKVDHLPAGIYYINLSSDTFHAKGKALVIK